MPSLFPTTRQSVVLALASDDANERTRAFDTLVTIYWRPLYKYARVAHHRDTHDAEDATQSFLARAFEKSSLATYDEEKASFRTFLRTLYDRHLRNEAKSESRLKRGGQYDFADAEAELSGAAAASAADPEEYFRREWVRSLFAVVVEKLHDDRDFPLFELYDLSDSSLTYREAGAQFGMSETTVTNRLAAMRRKFRAIVLDLIRDVTASDHEYREEVRALLGVEP